MTKPYCLAILFLASSGTALAQQVSASAHAGAWAGTGGFNQRQTIGAVEAVSTDSRDTGGRDGGAYTASAWAKTAVGIGALKVSGGATVSGAVAANAGSHAQYADNFVIDTGTLGETVIMNYSITVRGSLSASYFATESGDTEQLWTLFNLTHYITENPHHTIFSKKSFDAVGNLSGVNTVDGVSSDVYGVFSFSAQVTSGQHRDIHFSLLGQTFIQPTVQRNVVASTSYDLGNSVYWGGISSVTTLDGTEVSYVVRSDSGIDYAKSFVPSPVPEPSSAPLLLLGAAALLALRLQRARLAK